MESTEGLGLHDSIELSRNVVDLAPDDARWAAALPILQQLRPHLTTESFAETYRAGYPEGLRFTAMFDGQNDCLVVAGWRVITKTIGRIFYIDDLVVAEVARGTGLGTTLMQEMERRARHIGCQAISLDTGVQRLDAQRFYERFGMDRHLVYSYLKFLG